ncbi:MAG: hypothetical protein AB1744_05650, partial [Candidatus Zixiibacteriota bacterium]
DKLRRYANIGERAFAGIIGHCAEDQFLSQPPRGLDLQDSHYIEYNQILGEGPVIFILTERGKPLLSLKLQALCK